MTAPRQSCRLCGWASFTSTKSSNDRVRMTELTRAHKFARLAAIFVAGVFAFMLTAWVLEDPREHVMTDWTSFDIAADRLFSGENIYQPWNQDTEPLPYLYPPFALWLVLPLAFLGFWASFAVSALTPLAAYIAGLRKLGRAEPGKVDRTTGFIIALASGPAIGANLIGQYSGLYVLAFGAAALLYTKDKRVLAGLVLAFLWIKPNIAIVVPFALVWSRSWRPLKGFVGGTALMLALSLPFGLDRWSGFASNIANMAELQERGVVPIDKMVTVLSSAQTLFGLEAAVGPSVVIWGVVALILGVAVLVVWTPARLAESPVRAFGALAVFAVIANPRLYFYDSSLLLMGVYGLWLSASVRGSAIAARWTGILALLLWAGSWGSLFPVLNPVVGPTAALVLLVTAVDARRPVETSVTTVAFGADELPPALEISVDEAA